MVVTVKAILDFRIGQGEMGGGHAAVDLYCHFMYSVGFFTCSCSRFFSKFQCVFPAFFPSFFLSFCRQMRPITWLPHPIMPLKQSLVQKYRARPRTCMSAKIVSMYSIWIMHGIGLRSLGAEGLHSPEQINPSSVVMLCVYVSRCFCSISKITCGNVSWEILPVICFTHQDTSALFVLDIQSLSFPNPKPSWPFFWQLVHVSAGRIRWMKGWYNL